METYCLRMSQEIGKRCSLQCVVLPGREDGRGPSGLSIFRFGVAYALKVPLRPSVDVVHLGDLAMWPLGYLELLFRRARRLVVSVHGSDVSLIKRARWQSKLYEIYLRLGLRLVPRARLIANSSYIADLARSIGFENVSVVPLGTDAVASGHSRRSSLLFAGRISRAKGLRFLITSVLPLLPVSTRLRVAGPVWEESEQGMLEHPQVEYLGVLTPHELAAEFSRALITLVPSQVDEGFGLVAIEAAACGSQVVASNGGGLRDVVRAPWGDLVEANDAAAWAEAICRRISFSANVMERISQAAKRDIELLFRWDRAASLTIAHYSP